MPLTDAAIRAAKPKPKQSLMLSDGGGLQFWIAPTGSKLWRLAYRFGGKQKKLAIGAWPVISLKDARDRREDTKALLASGIDPGQQKKTDKAHAARERSATVLPLHNGVSRMLYVSPRTGRQAVTAKRRSVRHSRIER